MFCLNCGGKIKALTNICPYCGFENIPAEYSGEKILGAIQNTLSAPKNAGGVIPHFSDEECLIYGIHPDDEMYRKTMELDVLSKKYK